MAANVITKSRFNCGDDCLLATVNTVICPTDATQPDMQYIFDNGTDVGELARNLFPGAVTVEYGKYAERANRTRELINNGTQTICEASFLNDGLFAAIDILRVGSGNHVDIYEVKSSTCMVDSGKTKKKKIKDIFYRDIAFQAYLVEKSGYTVDSTYLVYINYEFVKNGPIDPTQFFIVEDVSDNVRNLLPVVDAEVKEMKSILDKGLEIDPPTFGEHCFKPYACPFWQKCKKALPKDSIFDIKGRMRFSTKVKLFYEGVTDMAAFLKLKNQNEKYVQQARLQVSGSNDTEVKMDELKAFLDTLQFPLTSLDFETIQQAIPVFDGDAPYTQIATQFSAHVLKEWGGALEHFEFLANPNKDWRKDLAHALVKACPPTGSILIWNSSMEPHRVEEMAEMPCNADIRDALLSIKERMVDLMVPFMNRVVYNRLMKGSYSLKYVLPALCPGRNDLSYEDLSVNNGLLASQVFAEMMHGKMSSFQMAATRRDLLTYCELDTYGPMHILNCMYHIVDPDCKQLFVVSVKHDHTQRTIRVGDHVATNIGTGTVTGFTPCFVRVRLDGRNRKILRMSHNLYNMSGLSVLEHPDRKIPEIPGGVVDFYDVTGRVVKLGDYVITNSQLGKVVGRTDYFLKIRLKNGKEVLRCGTFVIVD